MSGENKYEFQYEYNNTETNRSINQRNKSYEAFLVR